MTDNDNLGFCGLCGADRQALEREIERLRRVLTAMALDWRQEVDEVEQEGDEARRIALWLRIDWDGPSYDLLTAEQQAWLETMDEWAAAQRLAIETDAIEEELNQGD